MGPGGLSMAFLKKLAPGIAFPVMLFFHSLSSAAEFPIIENRGRNTSV